MGMAGTVYRGYQDRGETFPENQSFQKKGYEGGAGDPALRWHLTRTKRKERGGHNATIEPAMAGWEGFAKVKS